MIVEPVRAPLCYTCETASGVSCARRLYTCIQCQQIGLECCIAYDLRLGPVTF